MIEIPTPILMLMIGQLLANIGIMLSLHSRVGKIEGKIDILTNERFIFVKDKLHGKW